MLDKYLFFNEYLIKLYYNNVNQYLKF